MTTFLLNDYVYAQWLCFRSMTAYLFNDFLLVKCVSAVTAFLFTDCVSTRWLRFHSMTSFPLWLCFQSDCVYAQWLHFWEKLLKDCVSTAFQLNDCVSARYVPYTVTWAWWCILLFSSSKPLGEIASKPGLFDWFSHQTPSTRGQHFVYDDFSRWSVLVNRRWRWSRGRLAHLRS